jgi:hypothetical protein
MYKFAYLGSFAVKDLLSCKECLHVGNKEQDPGVMQSW